MSIFARFGRLLAAIAVLGLQPLSAIAGQADTDAAFRRFLDETVGPAARAAGVSDETFRAATDGLSLDRTLPDLVAPGAEAGVPGGAFQAEFSSPGRYLDPKSLTGLEKSGRAMAGRWADVLDRLERETGVPGPVVVAIWGRESNFGRAKIEKDAVRTLATQAFMGARREIFLPELVAALRILEEDHLPRALLRSSWAGALGQPQFLPTKFLANAVDGDGDGRRDIWTSIPDSLASIAHYLVDHGWRRGEPWGAEVALPATVSCTLEGPHQGRPAAFWAKAGVTRLDGAPLDAGGRTLHLMLPAGRLGPAFLVSPNFYVLKAYNESDLYALFVGHLSDRIAGPATIRGAWAKPSRLTRGDVRDLQQDLVARGHDVGGADGLVGFRTRIAIGLEQERRGERATCFPG